MAAISVAVEGDVKATAGAKFFEPATSGAWKADLVIHQTYSRLQVNGKPVIHKASCNFNFSGTAPNGATVTTAVPVTLSAQPTKLQKGAKHVLRDGDQASDIWGNKLEVSASNILRTT